jgi:hypothetical protein
VSVSIVAGPTSALRGCWHKAVSACKLMKVRCSSATGRIVNSGSVNSTTIVPAQHLLDYLPCANLAAKCLGSDAGTSVAQRSDNWVHVT